MNDDTPAANEASPMIGVREAASLLDVHENTIRNWVNTGMLTNAQIPGTHAIRLLRRQIEALAAGRHAEDVAAATENLKAALDVLRAAVADAQGFLDGVSRIDG